MDAGTERDTVESGTRPRGAAAKALAEAAWFPTVLFLGVIFFFAPALHAPAPHHVKVVVAGGAEADRVDAKLRAQTAAWIRRHARGGSRTGATGRA